jgi:hypothetical protein
MEQEAWKVHYGRAISALLVVLALSSAGVPAAAQLAPPYSFFAHANDAAVSVQLTWGMDGNLPYTAFRIYRRQAMPTERWTNAHLTSDNLLVELPDRSLDIWHDSNAPVGVHLNYTICAVYDGGQLCYCPGPPHDDGCSGASTMLIDDSYIPLANAPTGGSAVALDHNRIRVSWQDNSPNEDGFVIQRWVGFFSVNPEIGRVGPNVTEWVHGGLTPDTRYHYRVCAIPPGEDDGTVCTDPFDGRTSPEPAPPPSTGTPRNVHGEAISLDSGPIIRLTWDFGTDGVNNQFRVNATRTSGGPASATALPYRGVTLWEHYNNNHTGYHGWGHLPLGPNQEWSYTVCGAYDDLFRYPPGPIPEFSLAQIDAVEWRCAGPVSVATPPSPSLAIRELSATASYWSDAHRVHLTWVDPNRFEHGPVRTFLEKWSNSTGGWFILEERDQEKGLTAGDSSHEWWEEASSLSAGNPSLQSDTEYRYRVCTANLPLSGTRRRCAEVEVRTVDSGVHLGARTLKSHLEELRLVEVLVLQGDGRTLLPPDETCLSCPWQMGTRELRNTLEKAGVQDEVNLALLGSRGETVAEIGTFPVARDGSIPGLGGDLRVQGMTRIPTGEQCGLTLRVTDSRGGTLADAPFCVLRGDGR